jgi:DNA-binding transcriptional ArsR family regulator
MGSNLIAVAKALADDTRMHLVSALGRDGELSCGDLVARCQVGQSTVSHHLKILTASGLVNVRQDGQRSLFQLRGEAVRAFVNALTSLTAPPASRAAAAPGRGLPDLGNGVVD